MLLLEWKFEVEGGSIMPYITIESGVLTDE